MEMMAGKQFEKIYWMEGPLPGDEGCRITVLHPNQKQQCSHCLKRADSCPGQGNGKACETMKTSRGKIGDYMKHLKIKHGYQSLKMQFLEEQERAFPSLDGTSSAQDGFKHMLEAETDVLGTEETRPIIPTT